MTPGSGDNSSSRDEPGPVPPAPHLIVRGREGAVVMSLPGSGVLMIGRDDAADVPLNDPRASRHHAQLKVGECFTLTDLGSANGTRIRSQRLSPNETVTLQLGDPVTIGNTVLTLERRKPDFEARRVWAHGYLETRLIEECARAYDRGARLGLARLHVDERAPAAKIERILRQVARPGDLLAVYAPHEYEALLVDADATIAWSLVEAMVAALAAQGIKARAALARFPRDGSSAHGLMSVACDRLGGLKPAGPEAVVVKSRAMRDLYAMAGRIAVSADDVLIVGEAGSGKQLLAEGIHRLSPRGSQPFVALDCAAFPPRRLELELFGQEHDARDAGSGKPKVGALEAASGGTLFLNGVAQMPLAIQDRLLETLARGGLDRRGRLRPIDVRCVAASWRPLAEDVAEGRFREQLSRRLGGVTLELPPLRERPEDVPSLAQRFLAHFAGPAKSPPALSVGVLGLMRAYSWPGNVGELRNMIQRAMLLCKRGTISTSDLPAERMRRAAWPMIPAQATTLIRATPPAATQDLDQQHRKIVVDALRRCRGHQMRAAELLRIPPRRLRDLMLRLKIPAQGG